MTTNLHIGGGCISVEQHHGEEATMISVTANRIREELAK
jgi:hypothetical protein